ncbi:hypothetical protein J7T55_014065 [Diaporthe amygdali]|uniref:uncharacterized protein n=1 Tax=Phomopsis amygdali TaxID=1214568 RepID=UPI0022FDB6DC|nr:uncharacterized protein J7T55_014065 [Diaporthe amygdali]KAJ0100652.1 hypothetical protein J7T55_014065 [Diaporthe amygdali]
MSPLTKRKQNDGHPIHITNVMPGAEGAPPPKKLKIAEHRDIAIVTMYSVLPGTRGPESQIEHWAAQFGSNLH